jgi:hypothetical protein
VCLVAPGLCEKENDVNRSTKVTIALVAVATVGLVGWDINVAANDVRGDTISEVALGTAYKHPSLGLAWGILTGHLAWPRERPLFWRKPWTAILAGALVLLLVGAESWFSMGIAPILPLLPGILLGHWLWPQTWHSSTSS